MQQRCSVLAVKPQWHPHTPSTRPWACGNDDSVAAAARVSWGGGVGSGHVGDAREAWVAQPPRECSWSKGPRCVLGAAAAPPQPLVAATVACVCMRARGHRGHSGPRAARGRTRPVGVGCCRTPTLDVTNVRGACSRPLPPPPAIPTWVPCTALCAATPAPCGQREAAAARCAAGGAVPLPLHTTSPACTQPRVRCACVAQRLQDHTSM